MPFPFLQPLPSGASLLYICNPHESPATNDFAQIALQVNSNCSPSEGFRGCGLTLVLGFRLNLT